MGRVAFLAAVAAAFLASGAAANAAVVARPVGGGVVLRAAPGRDGGVVARLGRRTDFGSPLSFSVVTRRGRWLGVISPLLPNGTLGWIDGGTVSTSTVDVHLDVSLSRQRLRLFQGGRVLTRVGGSPP